MTTRRRFLALTAAAMAMPGVSAAAHRVRWDGIALGAEASIEIHGAPRQADAALRDAVAELRRLERVFSLHDPDSALSRLNRRGRLDAGEGALEVCEVMGAAIHYHHRSGKLFNPFVQTLWQALAAGSSASDVPQAAAAFGFAFDGTLSFQRDGQAVTLNGIAQGHVADRLVERLTKRGFGKVMVDTGEIRTAGGPWRLGLEDPGLGRHGWLTLEGGAALATSSPGAMTLADGGPHIVVPDGERRRLAWSSVTVEADTARHADACSTALAMAHDRTHAEEMAAALGGIRRVMLVDREGDVASFREPASA